METKENGRLPGVRKSNLELFRILTMLLIIAHHYVVNSPLALPDGPIYSNIHDFRSVFLLIAGAYGKIGINCFVFITGYFMCRSGISLRKFLKLYGEVVFYRIGLFLVFVLMGWEVLSVRNIFVRLLPFRNISDDFVSCFLAFWLCIPFLNILIRGLTEKQHLCLLGLLLTVYTGLSTLEATTLRSGVTMNYVSWFSVLYLIASYLRMYPKAVFERTGLWGWLSALCLVLGAVSVVYCVWFSDGLYAYYFVADSNKLLAVVTAFCWFNFFRTLNVPYSRVINALGGSTFGVLLIHAHSNAMREWLWVVKLNTVAAYELGALLPVHILGSVAGVFLVCACIDLLRIHLLEKPLLACYDRWQDRRIKERIR